MVLCPVLGKLQHKRVVLASASPRRQEILNNAGLRFEVVPSRFKETLDKASFAAPYAYAVETAKQKALEVAQRLHQKDLRAPDVVIGADTIVTMAGMILEKPVDKQDAYHMLSRLNGKEHSVFTGVVIVRCHSVDGRLHTDVSEFFEETRVTFSQLSEELLWEYINSGEPMDKAGGYGIQALGGMLVERVRGDFLNVVGFPLNHFCKCLGQLYLQRPSDGIHRAPLDSVSVVDASEHLSDGGGAASDRAALGTPNRGPGQLVQEAECNGTEDVPPPFPSDLMNLIDGFKASKAMFIACKLHIFDLLHDYAPQTAKTLALTVGASLDGLERLLDACAALGLLEKTEEGYSNSACARLHLRTAGKDSLHSYILYNHEHTWDLFTHLEAAVREGPRPDTRVPGREEEQRLQASCPQDPDSQLSFLRAMHSLRAVTARLVAPALDLAPFTSACDVGGGTGALAHELARKWPQLTVTVVDLPEVVRHSAEFQPSGPWTQRIHFRAGDFFQDTLPEADLFVLCRVLHSLAEDRVHVLLRRITGHCRPGTGILLVEALLDEDRRVARAGLLQDLDMLTRTPGRERTPAEYHQLLQEHGFQELQALPLGDLLVLQGTWGKA